MAEVLVVEDDHRLRGSLTRELSERGHHVRSAANGSDAIALLNNDVNDDLDIVVLDLNLPDFDGTHVLAVVRRISGVAVIIATGRDEEGDIIALLDAGADDYLVKPYSIEQLEARIRAVLRRVAAATPDLRLSIGELVINLPGRTATLAGDNLELSRKEFDVLALLASRPGEVISKRELLAEVWRQPFGGAEKTVDVHLSWLRRKLGESADSPRYLHTIRGVGVKLVEPA